MTEQDFDVQAFARDINELLVLSTLRDGTLYPILHRLEEEGLIRGSWSKDGGRRRKVYSLTKSGERHLTGETGRVQEIVSRLMSVLNGPGEAPI